MAQQRWTISETPKDILGAVDPDEAWTKCKGALGHLDFYGILLRFQCFLAARVSLLLQDMAQVSGRKRHESTSN